jgi:hypothetical protein
MKKRARFPQKIIDEYKRIAKNLLRKHADWDVKELPAEAFATPKGRQNEAESSAGVFSRCYV